MGTAGGYQLKDLLFASTLHALIELAKNKNTAVWNVASEPRSLGITEHFRGR